MKLATLKDGRAAIVEGASLRPLDSLGHGGLAALISRHGGDPAALARAASAAAGEETLAYEESLLAAPLLSPGKVIGIGRNYGAHAAEGGLKAQENPRVFFKASGSICGPGATVLRPKAVAKFDFEGELVAVVGATLESATPEKAARSIAGYMVGNDLSAREFQFDVDPPQTSLAKSMTGFAPIGPVMVTADELGAAPDLRLTTHVNGEKMQEAHTGELIFSIVHCLSYLSGFIRLEPGDLLFTGTPAGVGVFRNPPRFLKPGDVITVEIERIGRLTTRIG